MPSAFFLPKTKILEHNDAQILTFFPLSSSLKIRLIILDLYEFSLVSTFLPFCFQAAFSSIAVFKILVLLE